MDEAKTLVNMAISAMLSAMFIGAAVGIIGIGYLMWGYFARQDSANNAMEKYSYYTTYDNSTVRGQEVLQLIENNDDIFVIILQASAGGNMDILEVSPSNRAYVWYKSANGAKFPLHTEYIKNTSLTSNSIKTLNNALKLVYQWTDPTHPNVGSITDLHGYNSTDLQKIFLDRTKLGTQDNNYAAFKSVLIYADDSSSEISGVVLVKQTSYVTF